MKHYQPLKTKKDSQKMKKNISYQTIVYQALFLLQKGIIKKDKISRHEKNIQRKIVAGLTKFVKAGLKISKIINNFRNH